jgi:hypothetical protein
MAVRCTVLTMSIALAGVGAGGAVIASAQGGEADKEPKAILADVKRDLAKVKSLHFAGIEKEHGATTKISADLVTSGSADLTITEGKTTVRMIVLPKALYLKANAAYWRAAGGKNGAALAKKVAGRWVKAPLKSGDSLKPLLKEFSPQQLASCVDVGVGTLTRKGTTTIDGQDVVILQDAGDKPGTTPGLLYVTTTGKILPLRATQTGARKPGGKVDKRCQDADDKSTSGDITFGAFDKVPRIKAPHGAVDVEDLAGRGSGGGTPV